MPFRDNPQADEDFDLYYLVIDLASQVQSLTVGFTRFGDVPLIDVHLIENHSMSAVGGGETPIIAIAPAIGNAVFAATGIRLRAMPMQPALQQLI